MGHKGSKHKKDLTNLSEEEIDRLTKNTTYSRQQIQDWHQGFLRYEQIKRTSKLFSFRFNTKPNNTFFSFVRSDCPNGKLDKKKFLEVYKVNYLLNNSYVNFVFNLVVLFSLL